MDSAADMDPMSHVVNSRITKTSSLIILSILLSCLYYGISLNYGRDFNAYVDYFDCLSKSVCDVEWEVEITAIILSKTFGLIFGANGLVFLYIFCAVLTKLYVMSKLDNYKLVVFFYFSTYAFLLEANQIRAAVALGFMLLAIFFFFERKKKSALALFAVSVSLHISMISVLLDALTSKAAIILSAILLIVLSFVSVENIQNFSIEYPGLASAFRLISFASYLNDEGSHSIFNSKLAIALLLSIMCILGLSPSKYKKFNYRNTIFVWWSFLGLSIVPSFFSRISDIYLIIGIVFLIGTARFNLQLGMLTAVVWTLLFLSSVGLLLQ